MLNYTIIIYWLAYAIKINTIYESTAFDRSIIIQ